MTTAIYTRVSTEDQAQGYSLDTQLSALRAIAAQRGYRVVLEESDNASGSTLDRPGLTRLRDAVRAGLVKRVLVYDPDRLTRSLGHLMSRGRRSRHDCAWLTAIRSCAESS